MSKNRPFASNNTKDYNCYYNNKQGSNLYVFARNHNSGYNNNINPNFKMEDCSCNGQTNTSIINYNDYNTYINLSKASSYYNPSCDSCVSSPININDGLNSEINYNDLYENLITNNCDDHIKVKSNNFCKDLNGILFPYGNFNNKIKHPLIEIHSVRTINNCNSNKICNERIICNCSNENNKCCNNCGYNVTTPLNYKSYFKYKVDNNELNNNYNNLPQYKKDRLNSIQTQEKTNNAENNDITNIAINNYSISNWCDKSF